MAGSGRRRRDRRKEQRKEERSIGCLSLSLGCPEQRFLEAEHLAQDSLSISLSLSQPPLSYPASIHAPRSLSAGQV